MVYIYIIYSKSVDRFYIGQALDVEKRINEHNTGKYSVAFTKRAIDWNLVFSIKCSSRKQAILIEKHIKKMKSRKHIDDLLKYPEIIQKLKQKYDS